jgi:hypothetical protein
MKRTLLLAFAFVMAPVLSWAQVEPGDRVRVKTNDGHVITGTVGTLQEGRLELSEASWSVANPDAPKSFQLQEVSRLDESKGRGSNWKWGAGIGALSGLALAAAYCNSGSGEFSGCETDEAYGIGAFFIGIGAGLGAGIGALIHTERWENVPLDKLQVSVAPLPGRGVGVAFNLRF